ncbi:hypothetical protein tloyanaT_21710 [Thalassotalea loyana]|uniref:Uncharacterized protein n=1 Tax=Thalassotalea loyana TaxID=280483 RepID=A0ABQ6HD45_9GAMM|nr:hypothetical protein [Thalassotalea loyana]GLX85919.1 hypothetical protein tloyanaT_21710 [Thalassotalea loyana]
MFRLIFLLSLVSLEALASWTATRGGVVEVTSHNGYVLIDTAITDGPCDKKGGFYWKSSFVDSDDLLSLSLSSMATGYTVAVVFDKDLPNCKYGRAEITHMSLKKG